MSESLWKTFSIKRLFMIGNLNSNSRFVLGEKVTIAEISDDARLELISS